MRYEKSCGALVFRRAGQGLEVLLLQHRGGHWDFPKGHMEPGESERETALREVLEESGLTVRIEDESFRELIRFSPYPGCQKDVVYFIAFLESGELRPQPEEIAGAGWFGPQQASERITYQNARDLLLKALSHLGEKEGAIG
jgi:8-oxo-dGTP pyrophosphatase MutT (NUDIX family)